MSSNDLSSLSPEEGETELALVYRGREFTFGLHPKVAKPNYYSFFLADSLTLDPATRVLDVGTGTGILAILFARAYQALTAGSDLNPFAVALARENARTNGVEDLVRIEHGSLYEPFSSEIFDMVVCDPPFAPTPAELTAELRARDDWFYCNACGGADGRDILTQVINAASQSLSPHGRLVLVHPDYVGIEQTFDQMRNAGMEPHILAERTFPLGTLGKLRKSYIEATLNFRFSMSPNNLPLQRVVVIEGKRRR